MEARAELLAEEAAAGSDDPIEQARAILTESDARSNQRIRDLDGAERRQSEETVEPPEDDEGSSEPS